MARFYGQLLLLVCMCLTLALAQGCQDYNRTVHHGYSVPMSGFTIRVQIEGAGTQFPAVEDWYSTVPTITARPDLGPGVFDLWFNVPLARCTKYHVGVTFVDDWDLEQWGIIWHEEPPMVGALQNTSYVDHSVLMWFEPMLPTGYKLVVQNAFSPNPLAVLALEWTISASRLPLANLNWGDPVLEALPWEAVVSDTLWLLPGARQEFPVPPHLDQPCVYGLVRAISGDSAPYDLAEDVAQGYTYGPTDAGASTWGRIKAIMR